MTLAIVRKLSFRLGKWLWQGDPLDSMPDPTLLLFADSERSADMYYLTRVRVPDAFLAIVHRGRSIAVVNALEFTRVKREAAVDEVWSWEEWVERARSGKEVRSPLTTGDVVAAVLRHLRVRRVRVPGDFPAGLALALHGDGLRVDPVAGSLFPQRLVKTGEEAAAIKRANGIAARGFRVAEEILRASELRGRGLRWQGRVLTSEILRTEIEVACLRAGGRALNTIVAGGNQACDPHARGTGPLRPNELIIIDIFPQEIASGYHGDMTRTYLRGTPSDAQVRLVATVAKAQKAALSRLAPGVDGMKVHAAVQQVFAEAGYETRKEGDVHVGFFHGTGHGLGLEVHDGGRISGRGPFELLPGHVMTVEPGLYYPGLGGCRIEDVIHMTADGWEFLSRHPYRWALH